MFRRTLLSERSRPSKPNKSLRVLSPVTLSKHPDYNIVATFPPRRRTRARGVVSGSTSVRSVTALGWAGTAGRTPGRNARAAGSLSIRTNKDRWKNRTAWTWATQPSTTPSTCARSARGSADTVLIATPIIRRHSLACNLVRKCSEICDKKKKEKATLFAISWDISSIAWRSNRPKQPQSAGPYIPEILRWQVAPAVSQAAGSCGRIDSQRQLFHRKETAAVNVSNSISAE